MAEITRKNDSKSALMPLVSNKKEYYPIFEEVCTESLKEKISLIMTYLEKESDDHPRWEYEDTLEYYLKTRKIMIRLNLNPK